MHISNKRVLIFGGTGSLGRSLIRRLVNDNEVIIFSRDEAKHWTIKNELGHRNLFHEVGDIRDRQRVFEVVGRHRPNVILIASALKQVDTCENTPNESIQTNILGIGNVVDAAIENEAKLGDLEAVTMISTDKACAPTNVYGMCKALAERIVTNASRQHIFTRFIGVRYGNVLQSRGSIIPLFQWQAQNLDSLTVTHEDMTRYVMTLDQSIDLILKAVATAESGEIFLPRLRSMRIIDLAQIFAKRHGKGIVITGIRPGEKLHEELISPSESLRVTLENDVYRMRPSHSEISNDASIFSYMSDDDVMPQDELEAYLESIGVFTSSLDDYVGNTIEEIDVSRDG